jgi:hypothetical protein
VNFTLFYDGSLASNARPAQKHDMRLRFHPQLAELRRQPGISNADSVDPTEMAQGRFTSLVHPRWNFRADLDIIMLRPEDPGRLIIQGDIDNRLKTLFDALTRPQHPQDVPASWTPSASEDPVHCLLDDDSLVKSVSVRTDRLLAPGTPSDVKLVINVKVQTIVQFGGIAMWS